MHHDQGKYEIRCEWGEQGVLKLAPISDVVIIVDVLSFSTSVQIAVAHGGIVYPFRFRDETAAVFAQEKNAVLAGADRAAGLTLSPASMMRIEAGMRLVLPSPNGATLSLAAGDVPVTAGCLRNARAVAESALQYGKRIAVIAAGERWPDGSLRPGIEDWIGAGAIIAGLSRAKSPEAVTAQEAFLSAEHHLAERITACASGQELIKRGFAEDVALAVALNISDVVPVLRDGAYRAMKSEQPRD
jgi:2-phosphosulfolactate phosphatase